MLRREWPVQADLHQRERYIGLMLVISGTDAKTYYNMLYLDRANIDIALGEKLQWRELPNRKQSDIGLYKRDVEITDRDNWPQQHAWFKEKLKGTAPTLLCPAH